MNYLKIAMAFCLLASLQQTSFAQEEKSKENRTPSDTTTYETKNKTIIIIKYNGDATVVKQLPTDSSALKKAKPDESGLGMSGFLPSFNAYMSPTDGFNFDESDAYMEQNIAKSIGYSFNLFEVKVPIVKNYVILYGCLGANISKYSLANSYLLQSNRDSVFGVLDTVSTFKRNNFVTSSYRIPIMIEFNTNKNPEKSMHFGVGGFVGINVGASTTAKYINNGNKYKHKQFNKFHTNPFQYGLMAKIGYANYNVFAHYNINTLFKDGMGPELNQFEIGVMLISFK